MVKKNKFRKGPLGLADEAYDFRGTKSGSYLELRMARAIEHLVREKEALETMVSEDIHDIRQQNEENSHIIETVLLPKHKEMLLKLTAIQEIMKDEWLYGRVLPQYLGSEEVARMKAIRKVLSE